MSDCKPSEKSPTGDVDLTSISSILNVILGLFSMAQKPARRIPPPLLLLGKNLRPGMSARNLAARTIARLESEAGLPMGDVFSDGPNREALKVKMMSEELVSMIQTEAKVDVAIDPGAIQITAAGTAGPIPVVVQGANTLFVTGGGGVR
tara:strand:- start:1333 stop:1779 length:447 start_codon:yes stop_codon:yes gene_type:complete